VRSICLIDHGIWWAMLIRMMCNNYTYEAGTILIFRMYAKSNQKVANIFTQKLYGQNTRTHHGKYTYHKRGLLEEIPHIRLIRGVIIVRRQDAPRVEAFLKEYKAEYYIRTIELEPSDQKKLTLS
jgi:hypothetical protein